MAINGNSCLRKCITKNHSEIRQQCQEIVNFSSKTSDTLIRENAKNRQPNQKKKHVKSFDFCFFLFVIMRFV